MVEVMPGLTTRSKTDARKRRWLPCSRRSTRTLECMGNLGVCGLPGPSTDLRLSCLPICDRPWPEPHVFASRRPAWLALHLHFVCTWPAVLDVSIRRPGRETTGKALCVTRCLSIYCFVGCGVAGAYSSTRFLARGDNLPRGRSTFRFHFSVGLLVFFHCLVLMHSNHALKTDSHGAHAARPFNADVSG